MKFKILSLSLCALFLLQCAGPQTQALPEPKTPLPEFSPPQKPETKSESGLFPEFEPKTAGKHPLYYPKNSRPFIRVLIAEKQNSLVFHLKSPVNIYSGSPLSAHSQFLLKASKKLTVRACGSSICLESPAGSKVLPGPLWLKSPGTQTFNYKSESYKGLLWINNFDSKLDGVNFLSLEDYVKGILPYEIGTLPDWGFEALKAQAIAARTYSLRNLKELEQRHFDLYNDTRDQVYRGTKSQYPLSDKAVEETRSLVLNYQDELAQTYYHSTSGGHTADISQVWSSKPIPYLRGTPDLDANNQSWSKQSKYHHWEYTFKRTSVIQSINSNLRAARVQPSVRISELRGMKITQRTSSGRVAELQLYTDRGTLTAKGDRVRWLFNPHNLSILPSAHFDIISFGNQIKVSGRGFGHGIGLCQMGARARSKAGQGYEKILAAYYPGTQIKAIPY